MLPHVGGVQGRPEAVNEEGLLIKTHSICYGCWAGAPRHTRLHLENTSISYSQAVENIGEKKAQQLEEIGSCRGSQRLPRREFQPEMQLSRRPTS